MNRFIHILVVLILSVISLHAQQNNISPPAEDEVVVGAMGSYVNISALGGATYSIPIQVPDGIDGMQPNLSIEYNSQSGNGLLGWGWNLGGLSAITRTGHTNYHDGYTDGVDFDNDVFALDGQRLIVLDGASYGSNGAEYKTEMDGMSKIVSYTGNGIIGTKSFKVWTPDGLIMEYGNDSAMVVYHDGPNRDYVVIWLLNRIENREGNYVVFNYKFGEHDYWLNNIQYSGHAGSKTTIYGIDFHYYNNRVDKESAAIGNYVLYQPRLLKDISIYHWNQTLSKYEFVYDENIVQQDTRFFYNRLVEIQYEYEGVPVNPTIIDWGEFPEVSDEDAREVSDIYKTDLGLGFNTMSKWMKFCGDFNGDGLADFITLSDPFSCIWGDDDIQEQDSLESKEQNCRTVSVFLNKGNDKKDDNSGSIEFEEIYSFEVKKLQWIYVCDVDGDGCDEFLVAQKRSFLLDAWMELSVRKLKYINGEPYLDFVLFWDYNVLEGWFLTNYFTTSSFSSSDDAHLVVGDFLGIGRCDIIVQVPSLMVGFYYFTYDGRYGINGHIAGQQLLGDVFNTGDFNGDGRTEIWYANTENPNQQAAIVRINQIEGPGMYEIETIRPFLDCYSVNFLGDFNGDGHTDFLTFHGDGQGHGDNEWCLVLNGDDDIIYPIFYLTNQMIEVGLENYPGSYSNFVDNLNGSRNYFLEIGDLNGDGKSDVFVRNGEDIYVLYGGFMQCINNSINYRFKHTDHRRRGEIGLSRDATNFSLCLGNFLGQENVSLLCGKIMFSYPQNSIYYNVKNITDGMGNRNIFEYDYLIHNPKKVQGNHDENIYTLTDIGTNLSFDIYHTPLPIKAVKRHASFNVLGTGPISIDSCSYENVLLHRQGKGILGFQKTIHDHWIEQVACKNNMLTKHQGKTISLYDFKPMDEHCMNTLVQEETFRYKPSLTVPNEYEEIRVKNAIYSYQKFICSRDNNSLGAKVFAPLVKTTTTDDYELLGEHPLLRRHISKNIYNDLNNLIVNQYANTVRVTETWQGTDANQQNTIENCEFQDYTMIKYENDLANNWIINRPQSVYKESTRLTEGFAMEKSLTRYVYDTQKPYLPKKAMNYPSGQVSSSDRLAYSIEYYYVDGRVQAETLSSINDNLEPRYTYYEYDPYYRFKTKVTNSCGYETSYQYDDVYGTLVGVIDCNGYLTVSQNEDHLGITTRTYKTNNDATHTRINGTESVSALRWLEGSDYENNAPDFGNPSYFLWTKNEESAEKVIIYDATGRELRTITFGLRETGSDTIYQDTQFDDWGRIYKRSEPYYSDTQYNDIKWITYEYDDFDRITNTHYPSYMHNGNLVEPFTAIVYDGLKTITEKGAVIGQGRESHVVESMANVMGWIDYNKEYLDAGLLSFNTTTYGYNANGSLAWTKVNGDESTKVSMLYDDAGNRIELHDPDYGTTRTQYDAFGQLQWQETPKRDLTTYQYDNIGRLVIRTEIDYNSASPETETTTWNYSNTNGTKGLLSCITLGTKQIVTYTYDQSHYNNLQEVTKEHYGTEFTTSFLYGDSNFPLRVSSVTYPSGYTVEKNYDTVTGSLSVIRHNNQLLWKTRDANAFGQITCFEMGNGVQSTYQYDDRHNLSAQQASKNGNTIQSFGYVYDVFGNLAARTENKFTMPKTETFSYDYLNRLETITLNGIESCMRYDAYGRILLKEADGQEVFSDVQYNTYDPSGNLKPHAITSATMADNPYFVPSLEIAYTMFDKVKSMARYNSNGNMVDQVRYDYGYDHERIIMNRGETYEKQYIGNCEIITQNGNTQWNTFLSGPLGVFAVVTNTNNTEVLRYVYKDHLGSWTTITDDGGSILQELSFDAWGNYRSPATWSGIYNGLLLYDRGFTGHEHLFDYGLINMNGRMYDPVMSSFLSVDNFVQSPENSQSFNRYAYCLNNPLRYVDPDGEWFLTFGLDYGKKNNGKWGITGGSLGINFGLVGFGVHVNWANGTTLGLYGEIGPHIGNVGLTTTLAFDRNLTYKTSSASLSAGYGFSYGIGRAGLGVSGSYTWGLPEGISPWNASVSANLGIAGNLSQFGQMAGFGLSCSYGTQGWGVGAHSYCQVVPMSEKFNRIMGLYYPQLTKTIGEAFAHFYLGTNENLAKDGLMSWFGQIVDGDFVNGVTISKGLRAVGVNDEGFGMIPDARVYISKLTTLKIWYGNTKAIETLFHEYYHAYDFYSGEASRIEAEIIRGLENFDNSSLVLNNILDARANYFNYIHTEKVFYQNRARYYYNLIPDKFKYLTPNPF